MRFAEIAIEKIMPGKNIRRDPDEDTGGLMESIEKYDLIQPILVRPLDGGKYEVVAGLRRFRAMKARHEPVMPCLVRDDLTEKELPFIRLVENVQRKQMSASELVAIFDDMMKQTPGLKKAGIAKLLGKSQAWVYDKYKIDKLLEDLANEGLDGDLLAGLAESEVRELAHVRDSKERARVVRKTHGKPSSERVTVFREAESFAVRRQEREDDGVGFRVYIAGKKAQNLYVMCKDARWQNIVERHLMRLYIDKLGEVEQAKESSEKRIQGRDGVREGDSREKGIEQQEGAFRVQERGAWRK